MGLSIAALKSPLGVPLQMLAIPLFLIKEKFSESRVILNLAGITRIGYEISEIETN